MIDFGLAIGLLIPFFVADIGFRIAYIVYRIREERKK